MPFTKVRIEEEAGVNHVPERRGAQRRYRCSDVQDVELLSQIQECKGRIDLMLSGLGILEIIELI